MRHVRADGGVQKGQFPGYPHVRGVRGQLQNVQQQTSMLGVRRRGVFVKPEMHYGVPG